MFLHPDRVVRTALLKIDNQCDIAAGRPTALERLRAMARAEPAAILSAGSVPAFPLAAWRGLSLSLSAGVVVLAWCPEGCCHREARPLNRSLLLFAQELVKSNLDMRAERRTKVVLTGILGGWSKHRLLPPLAGCARPHSERRRAPPLLRLAGILFAQLAVFVRLTYWCGARPSPRSARSRCTHDCP